MDKFQKYFLDIIQRYYIITIHLSNGEQFDIGKGGVDKDDVACLPTCLSISDAGTHLDFPYHAIVKVVKYGEKI